MSESVESSPDASANGTSRRSFLTRALGVGGGVLTWSAAGCAPDDESEPTSQTPSLPAGKDPANFTLHSERPMTLETKRAAFGTSVIVPASRLYIRNNLPTPDRSIVADRDRWELRVEGVNDPRTVTVGALKSMGVETIATVLQCSGNGRRFFPHETSGSQWGVGAAGCLLWSGVPVRTVADELGGVADGMQFMTGTGGEELPEGVDRNQVVVERSVPLEEVLDDALLAWQMNGEPIPLVHGGPLRLIVPGYYGCNQIKYVKRLAFTPEESQAQIMQSSYRVRPVGVEGRPSQPSMWRMNVKSWINQPSATRTVSAGTTMIHGVAFSGGRRVERVEVSVDGGASWQDARFVGPDLGPYAWRQFALAVDLPAGTHTLASRATDADANTQPADRHDNHRGYGNHSWRDHAVEVQVA